MNEQEVWKDIKGYEGLYQVSNLGRIKSLNRVIVYKNYRIDYAKGKILTTVFADNGYKQITLYKDGNKNNFLVHRIVAATFIGNTKSYRYVNHKNCIKTDNNVNNLEWCTQKENCEHAKENGLYMKGVEVKKYNKKKKSESVSSEKIILDTQTGIFYDTFKEAADSKCLNFSYLKKALFGYCHNRTSLIYV